MTAFDIELNRRLDALRAAGLHRQLRRVDSPQGPEIVIDGKPCLNFSSNDYLGLANEPALKQAAIQAIQSHGAGAGSARLISGSLAPHHVLEETLANFKGSPAALTFSSGYATALGTICAIAGKNDVVIVDKLVHASIVDAARLSGATLRVFAHNDLNDLESILHWTARHQQHISPSATSHTLIITESVFSMDGDRAPLRELVDLKDRFGAWLMLDEAHATGLHGPGRRGLAEQENVADRIEIQMGTLGKAIGSAGGYICGSRALIDLLLNRARSFIFSTAPVPAAAAAAIAGIHFIQSDAGEERRNRLWDRIAQFNPPRDVTRMATSGAIIPILLGAEDAALRAAASLQEQGIFVPAIRYPTVARGRARLRITLTASHTAEHVARLQSAVDTLPRDAAGSGQAAST
jgi:8-amino-7-oxononanoate synthase